MVNNTISQNTLIPVPCVPVGIPFHWPTDQPFPDGTLPLDGRSFVLTDYPELARIYPSGVLPDYRGVVPRGMDLGRNLNPDAAAIPAGGYQPDEYKSHVHRVNTIISGGAIGAGANYSQGNTNSASSGGSETRGKAVLGYWLCYARTMFYDLTIEGANAYLLGGHPASYFASKQDVVNSNQVETWVASDGSSWYRKHSDGWLEQGGKNVKSTATIIIPFILPFLDTKIFIDLANQYTAYASGDSIITGSITTSQFSINGTSVGATCFAYWSAKGRWK